MARVSQPRRSRIGAPARLFGACLILSGLPAMATAQSVDHDKLEALFGEPVTTSVTGKPQRASEAPAALTIITRDDIRRSPARDIVGLVSAYAGIDVGRWTAGQSDISIRGGVQPYNARLLVLVNGHQVYLDHYGMTNWAGIGVELDDIQQIEVVRGPNSALFGFNAVSGVINIITINPLQTQQLTATVEAGDHGYNQLSAGASLKLGSHFGLRLSGGYGKSHELSGLASAPVSPVPGGYAFDPMHVEVAGELYARIDDATEAVVSASHSYSRQQEFIHVLLMAKSLDYFTSVGARISHDTGWGALSARVYRNQSDITAPIDVLLVPLEFHNNVLVASADALVRIGTSNTVRVGLEYRDNALVQKPGYPDASYYKVYALSGMWESALSDAVTLTVAGRLDHLMLGREGPVDQPSLFTSADFQRISNELSFNGALVAKVGASGSVRASIARGVQAPSLFDLSSRLSFPIPGLPIPLIFMGDPGIDPATVWSGELGYTRALGDGGSRLELTAFYNRSSDLISSPGAPSPPLAGPPTYPFIALVSQNVGSFTAYGLEASLFGHVGEHIAWMANYSWTHARQDVRGNGGTIGSSFAWPISLDRSTPEHRLNAQVSYERGPWLASMAARYKSGIQQLVGSTGPFALVDVPATVALDAKLAVELRHGVTFELAGENLTDAAGVDFSPIPAERRLRAGVRVHF
jgi:iron complex outermembrane receptor protein